MMLRVVPLACFLVCALVGAAAQTQTFPDRPIRIVVPFAAGGTVDIVARIAGTKLAELTGATVVVDNKGGAGGGIGTQVVAQAPGDGDTRPGGSATGPYEPAPPHHPPQRTREGLAPGAT